MTEVLQPIPPLPMDPFLQSVEKKLAARTGSLQFTVLTDKLEIQERSVTRPDLLQELRLQQRDIRLVDSSFGNPVPSLVVKEGAIIVAIMHVKAVIQANRILLFNAQSPQMQDFVSRLSQYLKLNQDTSFSFELKVFEAMLIELTNTLETELGSIKPKIEKHLQDLETNPEPDDLSGASTLLLLRNKLNKFGTQVDGVFAELHELWSSDEDMANMYLTTKKITGHRRRIDQHEEVELLVENYLRILEHVKADVGTLQNAIKTTDDHVNMHLDSIRNKIMRMSLLLSVATFSTTLASVTAAIFGMNLTSGLENSPTAFLGVTLAILAGNGMMFVAAYLYSKFKGIW